MGDSNIESRVPHGPSPSPVRGGIGLEELF